MTKTRSPITRSGTCAASRLDAVEKWLGQLRNRLRAMNSISLGASVDAFGWIVRPPDRNKTTLLHIVGALEPAMRGVTEFEGAPGAGPDSVCFETSILLLAARPDRMQDDLQIDLGSRHRDSAGTDIAKAETSVQRAGL